MVNILTINDPKQLKDITDEIHDSWFNVKNIKLDKASSVLTIKFEKEINCNEQIEWNLFFLKKVRIPVNEYLLKIANVSDYKINDTEQIDKYDFNKLTYEDSYITIHTGIPLDFKVDVDNIDISVEDTGILITEKNKYKIF